MTAISVQRLFNQQIAESKFSAADEIVGWMGAMQAQDYPMAKWAIGLRLQDSKDQLIEAAINRGDILRTHILRPTWHFVSADDIYWLLELTAPHIFSSLKFRHKFLEISDDILKKSNKLIEKALSTGSHLTREEIAKILAKARIKTDLNRLSHLLLLAELAGITCSGVARGNRTTYALLPKRVPHRKVYPHDESLAKLAQRYFNSRGPARLQDFIWWSGLPAAKAKKALELAKSNFISQTIDSEEYWFSGSIPSHQNDNTSPYFLAAFDEFLIGYKDRSAPLAGISDKKAISNNGIFHPLLVINGQVRGTWKRTIKDDKVLIEIYLFDAHKNKIKNLKWENAERFGYFLNKKTEIKLYRE